MSKKIIDWDTLKTELLGQPEVQAAFDEIGRAHV